MMNDSPLKKAPCLERPLGLTPDISGTLFNLLLKILGKVSVPATVPVKVCDSCWHALSLQEPHQTKNEGYCFYIRAGVGQTSLSSFDSAKASIRHELPFYISF